MDTKKSEEKKPKAFSEPGVVENEDGTVTVVLKKPVQVTDKESFNELTLREPLARDLEGVGAAKNEHTAQVTMIAQLSDKTAEAIRKLPAAEYNKIGRVVRAMMGNEPSDGDAT